MCSQADRHPRYGGGEGREIAEQLHVIPDVAGRLPHKNESECICSTLRGVQRILEIGDSANLDPGHSGPSSSRIFAPISRSRISASPTRTACTPAVRNRSTSARWLIPLSLITRQSGGMA